MSQFAYDTTALHKLTSMAAQAHVTVNPFLSRWLCKGPVGDPDLYDRVVDSFLPLALSGSPVQADARRELDRLLAGIRRAEGSTAMLADRQERVARQEGPVSRPVRWDEGVDDLTRRLTRGTPSDRLEVEVFVSGRSDKSLRETGISIFLLPDGPLQSYFRRYKAELSEIPLLAALAWDPPFLDDPFDLFIAIQRVQGIREIVSIREDFFRRNGVSPDGDLIRHLPVLDFLGSALIQQLTKKIDGNPAIACSILRELYRRTGPLPDHLVELVFGWDPAERESNVERENLEKAFPSERLDRSEVSYVRIRDFLKGVAFAPDDVIYELGCGDGRIALSLGFMTGAPVIAVELVPFNPTCAVDPLFLTDPFFSHPINQ